MIPTTAKVILILENDDQKNPIEPKVAAALILMFVEEEGRWTHGYPSIRLSSVSSHF